ncbi:hypothetical protein J2W17_004692 [Pseudomonas lini]|nr:hypothetical protein [Pseudomonas lini]
MANKLIALREIPGHNPVMEAQATETGFVAP